jgi:guanylate kinase
MSSRASGPGRVWIVSGPSGSGKTSLCEALLRDRFWRRRLMKSVSFTTRPKRPGEREGRDYRHISTEGFRRLIRERAFLEHEKIFGFYYGTPKKNIADARSAGKDLLLCIDVKGARTVRKFLKNRARSIFILPPGIEALSERLHKRATDDKKDIVLRMRRVKMELSYRKDYDDVVVNDDFGAALKKMKDILRAEKEGYVLRPAGKIDR